MVRYWIKSKKSEIHSLYEDPKSKNSIIFRNPENPKEVEVLGFDVFSGEKDNIGNLIYERDYILERHYDPDGYSGKYELKHQLVPVVFKNGCFWVGNILLKDYQKHINHLIEFLDEDPKNKKEIEDMGLGFISVEDYVRFCYPFEVFGNYWEKDKKVKTLF